MGNLRYRILRRKRPSAPGHRWQRTDFQNNFKDIRKVHFLRFDCQNFGETSNQLGNWLFMGYRFFFAIIVLILFDMSVACIERTKLKLQFIYLSHWSLLVQTIYGIYFFLVVLGNALHHYFCRRYDEPEEIMNPEFTMVVESMTLTRTDKLVWFLHNISTVFSFITFIIFLLYGVNPNVRLGPIEECNQNLVDGVFAMFGILTLLDISLCAIPFRLGHAWNAIFCCVIYISFALIYELSNGTYYCKEGQEFDTCQFIYPVFNWAKRPGHSALAFLGYSLLGGVIHVVIFLFYKFRLYIMSITCKKDAFLDHQYPFYMESARMQTSKGHYGVTDPENPFPRRILINDGLPISRGAALEEVKKIRKIIPLSKQSINYETETPITPFPLKE